MTRKLTRDQLVEKLKRRIAVAEKYPDIEEAQSDSQIFRLALSCLESEPVASIDQANLDYLSSGADADVWPPERAEDGDVLLYASPQPAPVVPLPDDAFNLIDVKSWNAVSMLTCHDACRAATLSHPPDVGNIGNSPAMPEGSSVMLRRWLAFGRSMQNAGSQLPRNLIAETEDMLAAAPQEVTSARVHPARDE